MVEAIYGAQFRKKLLSVKETEGLTNEEVAKRFGVSKGSVLRWKHDPDPYLEETDQRKSSICAP